MSRSMLHVFRLPALMPLYSMLSSARILFAITRLAYGGLYSRPMSSSLANGSGDFGVCIFWYHILVYHASYSDATRCPLPAFGGGFELVLRVG